MKKLLLTAFAVLLLVIPAQAEMEVDVSGMYSTDNAPFRMQGVFLVEPISRIKVGFQFSDGGTDTEARYGAAAALDVGTWQVSSAIALGAEVFAWLDADGKISVDNGAFGVGLLPSWSKIKGVQGTLKFLWRDQDDLSQDYLFTVGIRAKF